MTQSVDWWAISPPVCLVVAAILALLGDVFLPAARRWLPTAISLAAVVTAAVLALSMSQPRSTFCVNGPAGATIGCSWQVDHVVVVWWSVVLVAVGLVILMLHPLLGDDEPSRDRLPPGELHLLLLSSAAGALAVAASGDLVTLLVSIELVTLPTFALVGLRRDGRGGEAALKIFLVSVVATAFSLLGIAMVYGATGSVLAGPVARAGVDGTAVTPVIGVGMALTLAAFGFKVAVVPFQAWVPDTYAGAPVPVAAYLSVVSKTAGLAGLVVVLVRFFPAYDADWRPVVAAGAALTMTLGNLAALRQQDLVRLLAWSSVAQAGYLIVPLAAGGDTRDLGALQSYALMYAVVNMAAFAAVGVAARWRLHTVSDLVGLARSSPLVGVSLAFALLCLAGLPPGVLGLVAKVVIFQSAVDGGLGWLAVVMAVNVAIGLVYYLRVIAVLVQPSASGPVAPGRAPRPVQVVLALTLLATVALSCYPSPLFGAAYG